MTVNLSALAGAGQQFFDNNGNPLAGGKLWSYQAGTTTPKTTYTTSAGNVAHTNPIILDSAGRVATGEIWLTAGENYKFVLMTSANVTIATWDNITGINGTGIATNAENVQYDPPFTGGVQTNVEAKLAQTVSVKDFGAVGDGVADDSAAINAALAASNSLVFPSGTYYLGEYDSSTDLIFQLHNDRYDLWADGDVEFVIRTVAGIGDCFPVVFDLKGATGSSFGAFSFRDLGFDDSTSNRRGLKAYRLTADGTTGTWGDVSIDRIQCVDCISPISFEGTGSSTDRVQGVNVNEINVTNCYYGPLAQNQGDNVTIGILRGEQIRRIYFIYGCKTHNVQIIDRNPKGSTGTINISRSIGGRDTEDINVRYSCRDATLANQLYVNINHIDLLGGTIKGIWLYLDIDTPVAATPLRFINYNGSGAESTAPSLNVVDDIVVTGRFGVNANAAINTVASYATRGNLDVAAYNAVIGPTTRAAFLLENDSGTWTPVLVDNSLNPSEGQTASVAVGRYQKTGNTVYFTGRINMSSLGTLNVTQSAAIIGLPYTSNPQTSLHNVVNFGFGANLNMATASALVGTIGDNASHINIRKWDAVTGTSSLAISEITATGQLIFSGTYII